MYIEKKTDNKERRSDDRWVLFPIVFEDQTKPLINHWTRESDKDKVFSYQKFNVKVDMVSYTPEEYDAYVKVHC